MIWQNFICTNCEHQWTAKPDRDGLFDGYGSPRCPICGEGGCDPSDYGDFECPYCGHKWRKYGNGGLVFGCIPKCPKCGV